VLALAAVDRHHHHHHAGAHRVRRRRHGAADDDGEPHRLALAVGAQAMPLRMVGMVALLVPMRAMAAGTSVAPKLKALPQAQPG
jgi:hypothetical protein